jgi:hypothetical protein
MIAARALLLALLCSPCACITASPIVTSVRLGPPTPAKPPGCPIVWESIGPYQQIGLIRIGPLQRFPDPIDVRRRVEAKPAASSPAGGP